MNHGISAYRSAVAQPAAQSRIPEARTPALDQPSAAGRAASVAAHADLAPEERAMIDRYFPASAEMSMRVYGPGRQSTQVNPSAVGGRLDIRG